MRIHINALEEIQTLSRNGISIRRIAAHYALPINFVHKVINHEMCWRSRTRLVAVEIPNTRPGPYYCPGCGGALWAVPCVKCRCEGVAVLARPLLRTTGREEVVA